MGAAPAFLNTVDYSSLVGPNDIKKVKQVENNTNNGNNKNQLIRTEKANPGNSKTGFVKIQLSKNGNGNKKQSDKTEDAEEKLQRIQQIIAKLQMIDQKVRAHEMAHMAVGGSYAGGASYSYVQGPDGRLYAVAGEVPIDISDAPTPEETVVKMQTVIAAALAPADPSPQDLKVAAIASQKLMRALMELSKKQQEKILNGKQHHQKGQEDRTSKPIEDSKEQAGRVNNGQNQPAKSFRKVDKNNNQSAKGETTNGNNREDITASGFAWQKAVPFTGKDCINCQGKKGYEQNPLIGLIKASNATVIGSHIFNAVF